MGCPKLPYKQTSELKLVYINKELTLKNTAQKLRSKYFYGFQGQEKDDEVKGEGNSINYKLRMYDPRIGRFFATDPYEASYPAHSTYSFVGNNPISNIEVDGGWWFEKGKNQGRYSNNIDSQYGYEMNNVRAVSAKQTSLISYVPYIGNLLGASAIAQKYGDPTMNVTKSDIASAALAGYFRGTRSVIKAIANLSKAAKNTLRISEETTNVLNNMNNSPELAESWVELEVMRHFDGITTESGNKVGSIKRDNEKGWSTSFSFSKEFIGELENKYSSQFENEYLESARINISNYSDEEIDSMRKDYVDRKIEGHLKDMFEEKKKEILDNAKSAIETYEKQQ